MEELAELYAVMAPMHPREVDELELWECASLLGLHRPQEPAEDPGPDLIAERVKAQQEGRPAPNLASPKRGVQVSTLQAVPRPRQVS